MDGATCLVWWCLSACMDASFLAASPTQLIPHTKKEARIPLRCPTLKTSAVMFNNGLVDLGHQVQGQLWVDKLNRAHGTGRLCPWVSTFHPGGLACELEGGFRHGSFNAGVKMVFSDGTA